MAHNEKLSKESMQFLENLRVYLFSSGKKSKEIDEIVDELEIHLTEAEENGKSIEKIIGKSPKEYMEMVSYEMTTDYRKWIKYIWLIIFGAISIEMLPNALAGKVAYTATEIIGDVIITMLFITMIFISFKYISTHSVPLKMQAVLFGGIGIVNIGMFIGLIYLNRAVESPVLQFGIIGSYILGIIAVLFLIGMSIWSKTLVLIVIVALLTLPDYILGFTSLSFETQQIASSFILFAGIGVYLGIVHLKEKRSGQGV